MKRLVELGQLILYIGLMCLLPLAFCAVAGICVVDMFMPHKKGSEAVDEKGKPINLADSGVRDQGGKMYQSS